MLAGGEAVILLDAAGTVREISPAAEAILAAGDGISVSQGQVSVADRRTALVLKNALQGARNALSEGSFGEAVVVPRPSGKRPYVLTTSPLPRFAGPFAAFAPAVALRVIDGQPDSQPTACKRWMSAFALTEREAKVAEGLLANHSVESLAEQLGITRNTARNHITALFRKTNTTRQAELVKLLSDVARP
jgi:DNA-binding CsgD family transcriptional regulator